MDKSLSFEMYLSSSTKYAQPRSNSSSLASRWRQSSASINHIGWLNYSHRWWPRAIHSEYCGQPVECKIKLRISESILVLRCVFMCFSSLYELKEAPKEMSFLQFVLFTEYCRKWSHHSDCFCPAIGRCSTSLPFSKRSDHFHLPVSIKCNYQILILNTTLN